MELTGRTVRFFLSAEGRGALRGFAPQNDPVEALVVDEDRLGAWIWFPEVPTARSSSDVMLLKWNYFSSAVVTHEPQMPQERTPAGFKP